MNTLALVDLSAIFWRNYMSRKDADPVDAPLRWTVGKVRRLAEEYGHLAVCCDAKANWRRELCGTYKAGRAERPPEAWAQLDDVRETLRRDGFPVWCVEGYEADDLIASAVAQVRAIERVVPVVIVTSDKDLLQLVNDDRDSQVSVLTLGDPKNQPRLIGAADCAIGDEKVAPQRVRDFLALTGDGSDNVPGVKGIGPKGAARLLADFGSFPGVIQAVESEEPKLRASKVFELLKNQKATAELSWTLVGLKDDAPIDVREALQERKAQPVASPSQAAGAVLDAELDGDEEEGEPVSGPRTNEATGSAAPAVLAPVSSPRTTRGAQLATVEPVSWSMQLEPTSGRGAWALANHLANSRMFPQLVTPEQVLAAILLGRVHGLPAAVACMGCAPIKGKMAMGSAMLIGIVQKHPLCEYFDCVEANEREATWLGKRVGRPERELTFKFEQAVRAGYTWVKPGSGDGSWQKDPETMLYWRCGTRAARRWWPDVVAGVYSVEELADSDERAA